ncbi:MAG: hypothetical protein KAR42_01330 [candidate division Zixibacteria bacterium]|nr:hypothetical protein [candidate division Zixibacteria bacterium]
MFEFLREMFKSDDLLQQAFDDTSEMLHEDYIMFEEAIRSLRHSDNAEMKFDIYAADKKINKYERAVRRKVLSHLAIAKPTNVAPGLVLISVVNDVERIGDYTKNIYELANAHPNRLNAGKYEEKLVEAEKVITEKFNGVTKAYSNSDEELANKLMQEHGNISSWCDSVVNELISSKQDDLQCGDGVAIALYVRHLKRISAHLTNIVSSVVNPFPRIGYRSKE